VKKNVYKPHPAQPDIFLPSRFRDVSLRLAHAHMVAQRNAGIRRTEKATTLQLGHYKLDEIFKPGLIVCGIPG
jgi:hypothetical protein